jgi:hypothetical protein
MSRGSAGRGGELTVITKTYDLLLWTCNHTSRFPRSHRHVLGEKLEQLLLEVLDLLIACRYRKERSAVLQDVNLRLEQVRYRLRLARDLKCLEVASYGFGTRSVDEIGRLVGSWLKKLGPGG